MAEPLNYLQDRASEEWIVGFDSWQLADLAQQRVEELRQGTNQPPLPRILIAEANPLHFLASLIAACTVGCPVFLGNPNWTTGEWQQVVELVHPDLVWGDQHARLMGLLEEAPSEIGSDGSPLPNSLIMIPTGGSSGKIRFAMHTWATLTASVQGFRQYFQLDRVNSFCVLPLYHVSGLMQFLRSLVSGGQLVLLPFKALESGPNPAIAPIEPADFFLSLVPTQLQRLLEQPEQATWLSRFRTVLLGGGPASADLLSKARHYGIQLAPTYGMTETASQVATLKPQDFLQGNHSCGQVLPHASITIRSATGEALPPQQTGIITIQAYSLALGYYPTSFDQSSDFQLDDLGFFDSQGYLHIVGRNSNKIITGGENVFPAEVEAAILATNGVMDVCVIGLPDPQWGQLVTAVYVPKSSEVSVTSLRSQLESRLSKYKLPKQWLAVKELPRNAQGKVNYEQLREWASKRVLADDTAAGDVTD